MAAPARTHFTETLAALAEEPTEECVLWPFSLTGKGYPQLWYDLGDGRGTRRIDGHALACHLTHGPRPAEGRWEAAHGCGVRACFNPAHLRWATPAENTADREAAGTILRGERHGNARLADDDIPAIRRRLAAGDLGTVIAADYGVSITTISNIKQGVTWSCIPA